MRFYSAKISHSYDMYVPHLAICGENFETMIREVLENIVKISSRRREIVPDDLRY